MPLMPDDSPLTGMQFTPHSNQNIDFIRRQLLYIFNVSTVFCTLLFGIAESRSFGLNKFDQIAYPPLLICLLISLLILGLQHQSQRLFVAKWLTMGAVTLYVFGQLQVAIQGYPVQLDLYSKYSICIWPPGVYALYYAFLSKYRALGASVLIYSSLLLSVLVKISHAGLQDIEVEEFTFLFLTLLSQPLYIISFSTISRLYEVVTIAATEAKIMALVADLDALTNIANRRAITHCLKTAIAQHQDTIVILLDVDRFKAVNDTFGHDVGDQVLITTAELLRQAAAPDVVVGRWGGEEFVVLVPLPSPLTPVAIAEYYRRCLEQHEHPIVGQVTASFGVAVANATDSVETIIKRADQALYQAKQRRNTVVLWADQVDSECCSSGATSADN